MLDAAAPTALFITKGGNDGGNEGGGDGGGGDGGGGDGGGGVGGGGDGGGGGEGEEGQVVQQRDMAALQPSQSHASVHTS